MTGDSQMSIFSSEEHPANPSASPDSEQEWQTRVATWPSSILRLLNDCGPSGWYGKTSPASCHRTEEGILEPFSGAWSNSGMGSPTECLTLSISEHHSGAVESTLSDFLETGDVPRKYYLTERQLDTCEKRAPGFRASTLPGWQRNRPCQNEAGAGQFTTARGTGS